MHVVARWAALPDPPLELCIEAAALCGELLGSGEPLNQDVGVQLVAATLRRWGGYIAGALSTAFARQVGGVGVGCCSGDKRCLGLSCWLLLQGVVDRHSLASKVQRRRMQNLPLH